MCAIAVEALMPMVNLMADNSIGGFVQAAKLALCIAIVAAVLG